MQDTTKQVKPPEPTETVPLISAYDLQRGNGKQDSVAPRIKLLCKTWRQRATQAGEAFKDAIIQGADDWVVEQYATEHQVLRVCAAQLEKLLSGSGV